MLSRRLFSAVALMGATSFAVASSIAGCASEDVDLPVADAGVDAKTDAARDGGDAGKDAGPARNPEAWCAALGTKQDTCDKERECGIDFATWCPKQAATNSYSFEKADTACVAASCDGTARSGCRYAKYAEADLTDAQKALATAYCQTCSPNGVDACVRALYSYDAAAGPGAVTDAYVAVWELSDGIVNEIKNTCTKKPTPAGSTCAKAFGGCAADVYLNALPACK
jgi:hypothetical protein